MDVKYKMSVSTWIMIITALVWLTWDVYAYLTSKPTLSIEVTLFAEASNIFELAIGIVLGHWLWPRVIER